MPANTPPPLDKNVPGYVEKLTWLESLEASSDQRSRRLAARAWGGLWPVALAILIVLAVWQLIHISGWKNQIFPGPGATLSNLWHQLQTGLLWHAIGTTAVRAVLGFGLAVLIGVGSGFIAVFGALRGFGPSTPVLFTATFLMGVGVAVSQPAFPSLVREWFPRRIAIATAVYSNGILIGETLPTALTTPVGVLPLAHGDWRWALASWSVLVIVSGAAIVLASPAGRAKVQGVASRWWPSWRESQSVRIGLVIGMAFAARLSRARKRLQRALALSGKEG